MNLWVHSPTRMLDFALERSDIKVHQSRIMERKYNLSARSAFFPRPPSVSPEGCSVFSVIRNIQPISSFLPRNTRKPAPPDTEGDCGKMSSRYFNHDSTTSFDMSIRVRCTCATLGAWRMSALFVVPLFIKSGTTIIPTSFRGEIPNPTSTTQWR